MTNLDSQSLSLGNFDIVQSLEVAEHLPQAQSENFVKLLTKHSELVLFSAAIKKQGGLNHINEQFPQFWNNLFIKEGYECFDILRDKLWNNDEICFWYRQNILIFAKGKASQHLKNLGYKSTDYVNAYIHPKWLEISQTCQN